jgi:molybdopterin-guanine dinucleotide biosynthesis adapter protein
MSDKMKFTKPVLGFAAFSGTGKTTLLVKLIPVLRASGIRVAMIKQTHHDFEIDKPGKDSFELRKAGADKVVLASAKRSAVITEYEDTERPELGDQLAKLDPDDIDIVMVEGFKHLPFAKIELHRSATGRPLLYPEDGSVIAVVSDEELDTGDLPLLDINATEELAEFIKRWLLTY